MNPALSVVFFSTLSGAGLGLLGWLGFVYLHHPLPLSREFALVLFATGLALLVAGLIASLFHLGQPQRAWRALSQWRSSWLSREGVLAIGAIGAALALAALVWFVPYGTATRVAAAAVLVLAVATVVSTAKIYDTLTTIRAWQGWQVVPGFLLFAAASGALWYWLLLTLAAWQLPRIPALALLGLCVALGALKLAYWRHVDRVDHLATPESATGLGRHGSVRPFEAPHTEANFLLREMGYVLARKHSRVLRAAALSGFALAPAAAAAWAAFASHGETPVAALALCMATLGVFLERWLFFAEARHVVVVYYRGHEGR